MPRGRVSLEGYIRRIGRQRQRGSRAARKHRGQQYCGPRLPGWNPEITHKSAFRPATVDGIATRQPLARPPDLRGDQSLQIDLSRRNPRRLGLGRPHGRQKLCPVQVRDRARRQTSLRLLPNGPRGVRSCSEPQRRSGCVPLSAADRPPPCKRCRSAAEGLRRCGGWLDVVGGLFVRAGFHNPKRPRSIQFLRARLASRRPGWRFRSQGRPRRWTSAPLGSDR